MLQHTLVKLTGLHFSLSDFRPFYKVLL